MRIDITRRARARAIIETGYWGSLVSGAFLLSITAWIDGQHLLSPRPFTREEILFHLSFLLSGGFLLSIPVGIRHKAFRLARYLGAMATTSVISASVLLFSQLGLSVVSNLGISSILALFALFPACIIAGTLWYPREAAKPDVTNNKYHRKSLAGLIYSFLALILFVFILLSYKNMGSTWTAWFTRFYPSLFAWPLVSFLSRKGKQHRAMLARELIKRDDRTPILLLRSFSDDNFKVIPTFRLGPVPKTFEEAVAEELLAFGPITGIGKPGEQLPLLGAYREYVSYEDWQLRVRDLMSKAAAVIAIAGSTEGLLWEFDQIIALNLIHRVLLVFPPTKEAGEMMSFGKKTLRLEVDRKERWKAISQNVAPNLHVDTIPSDDEIENSLVAFFRDGACTLITGKGQSDMYYREALREAMYLVVDDDYSVRSSRAEKVIWTIGDLLNTLPLALLKPKSAITRAINSTPFWFAHLLLASLGSLKR